MSCNQRGVGDELQHNNCLGMIFNRITTTPVYCSMPIIYCLSVIIVIDIVVVIQIQTRNRLEAN